MRFLEERRRQAEERRLADPTSAGIGFLDEGENLWADAVDAGHARDWRAQKVFILVVVLLVLLLVAMLVPKNMFNPSLLLQNSAVGASWWTPSWFATQFSENMQTLVLLFAGDAHSASRFIHYLVIALAGAGLALSGAVYQGAFRNALVSPSTLGVMTGGQFGMALWVLVITETGGTLSLAAVHMGEGTSWMDYLSSSYGLAACSFLGCFAVVALVLLALRMTGGTSGIMMIITGQVVGGIVGVFCTLVRYYYATTDPFGDAAQFLQEVAVATFIREFTWIDIVAVGVPLVLTFLVVMHLRQRMMTLALDKTEQRTLGVNTKAMNFAVVTLCTLLTAIIISFCGTVGFVGFLVPHLARRLVGPNFEYLLPAATVLGAIFVLGAYVLLEATVGVDYAQMVGMFISIAGAAVFLVTALRGKGVRNGAFN